MLASYGFSRFDEPVARGIEFIRREQEPDGSWFGRWGVNYLYGTYLVLRGLDAVGLEDSEVVIRRAADWIRARQNPDGGWGESCDSYDDPSRRGIGLSTPSQTAWALLGLFAAGDSFSAAVNRGVKWLFERQNIDGSWDETVRSRESSQSVYTGTGFPRVFYLAYTMYRQYFPLLALSEYAKMAALNSGAN